MKSTRIVILAAALSLVSLAAFAPAANAEGLTVSRFPVSGSFFNPCTNENVDHPRSLPLRRWRFRRNEGRVECQALVYFRDAAQRLGASAEQAEHLYPYALALHGHQIRIFPRYRDPKCVIPPWAPPSE